MEGRERKTFRKIKWFCVFVKAPEGNREVTPPYSESCAREKSPQELWGL
jgi:hypothetical protein